MACISLSTAQVRVNTPFEKSDGQETATYFECLEFYRMLSEQYRSVNLREWGVTDSGHPLHVVQFARDGNFDFPRSEKIRILVLNGIHPGEPAGVDASMIFLRDLAEGEILADMSDNIQLSIIPLYNVGGALNRNATSRANQIGPSSYGFRGNAKNLDLNRDFMKMDARNSLAFVRWFHHFDPEIFVDTHTSNGADFQYVMTFVETHPQKLGGQLGAFQRSVFVPSLMNASAEKGYEMSPYVNAFGRPPDDGFSQFYDSPRYSTGFAALFQTMGFMSEAHMLKSFKDRVSATYVFLWSLMENAVSYRADIKSARQADRGAIKDKEQFVIAWAIDSTSLDTLNFKGFRTAYRQSRVTGGERLYYDRSQPVSLHIPYFNHLKPVKEVARPEGYILPGAWERVIERLLANDVYFKRFDSDTLMELGVYYIHSYQTYPNPVEGHYKHYNTSVKKMKGMVHVHKGDYFISCDQPAVRYLMEALEPEAEDSFFNWNFFDPVLQQKEYFSGYVFEDIAEMLLAENTVLKDSLDQRKREDSVFRNNPRAQLNFVYRKSDYFEKSYRMYPVYRLE